MKMTKLKLMNKAVDKKTQATITQHDKSIRSVERKIFWDQLQKWRRARGRKIVGVILTI